jgi:hypothetical protein
MKRINFFPQKQEQFPTLQSHRFGNFRLDISKLKVEIIDIVHGLSKHVYKTGSYEYGLFAFLLAESKRIEDGKFMVKSEQEVKDGINNAEFLVSMLAHSNLIFSDDVFRAEYYKLVQQKYIKTSAEVVTSEDDEKIIEEEKVLDEMNDTVE